MKPIVRNILAVVAGLLIGGFVNMGIILISNSIIPPPAGVDVTTEEGLKAGMHLFTPINFLMPFLAHALGTFLGALIVSLFAANNQLRLALTIGGINFIGGLSAIYMLPSPLWFSILDLVGAYFPMAYIALKLASSKK